MQIFIQGAKSRAALLTLFVGSIWLVSLVGFLFSWRMGVVPRSFGGLLGVATAPWFHANLAHLLSNTIPLIVLGWLVVLPRPADFWVAFWGSLLGAGAVAWLLGSSGTVHIGASGLVFGFFGYILARGLYTRRFVDVALAIGTAAVYGLSMVIGLLPLFPGVSWQSHLGGAIGGVLAARLAKEA